MYVRTWKSFSWNIHLRTRFSIESQGFTEDQDKDKDKDSQDH